MAITRTFEIDDLAPAEAAKVFADWFGEQQAAFFDDIAAQIENWRAPWCFQCAAIEPHLTDRARTLIRTLAEYAGEQVPA